MTTEKELGKALKDEQDEIIIEGDLAKKVIKIHAKGKVAWAVAFGAISVAIVAVISIGASAGTSTPAALATELVTGTVAASSLGMGTAVSAIMIGVAAGGAGALNKLRKYKLIHISNSKVILRKK